MELQTERLRLRELREDDVDRVLEYQSDPDYLRHYGKPAPTRDEARAFVAMLCGWAREVPRTRYQLAITLDGLLIGTCGVRKDAPDSDEAEYGCELDPRHWRRGYAREASRAILDFAIATLGVRRIRARTSPANLRAIALARDLGLQPCGEGLFELHAGGA